MKGAEHVNADVLSRIKDPLEECDCYGAGQRLGDLPNGGYHYLRGRISSGHVSMMT